MRRLSLYALVATWSLISIGLYAATVNTKTTGNGGTPVAASDLTNGSSGSGQVVLATGATINAGSLSVGSANLIGDPQFFVPSTGGTVAPTATGLHAQAFINPAGTLSTLTFTLPTGTLKGQTLTATFTQTITTLTVTGTNVDTKGLASPAAAANTSSFTWAWDSVSTKWNRIQ